MKTATTIILATLAALVSSCTTGNRPSKTPADCMQICNRGTALGCDWANPLPDGATCFEVCESANTILPWTTDCVNASATCEQAAVCR